MSERAETHGGTEGMLTGEMDTNTDRTAYNT
jgi:hypothetical protein